MHVSILLPAAQENRKVDASGAAHITITATKEFSASADGGSSVQYRGDAIAKVLNSSGGSSIKKKQNE